MSLENLQSQFNDIIFKVETVEHLDLSLIIIPFSRLFKKYKTSDIYSGAEKIPFKERNSDYKSLLKQEFANAFNVEFRVFSSVIKFPSF